MLEPDPQHYKPEDFGVGSTVTVYGRDIYLYDCDEFTREFYKRYTGYSQPCSPLDEPRPVHVKLTFPPHTGFGTEEDSLASCLHLTPRAPRRDINKLMGDAVKVLRFQGQMVNGKMEDTNRRFVVAIYLADESVGVWELRQRNSGHAEGKFAAKAKKRNPATGTWFTTQDFQIGATVEINCTPFKLLRGDDSTLSYMEKYPEDYPCSDIRIIGMKLARLQSQLASKGDTLLADEVSTLAEDCGVFLDPHELVTLRRACGVAQDDVEVGDALDGPFDAAEAPSILATQRLMQLIDSMGGGR